MKWFLWLLAACAVGWIARAFWQVFFGSWPSSIAEAFHVVRRHRLRVVSTRASDGKPGALATLVCGGLCIRYHYYYDEEAGSQKELIGLKGPGARSELILLHFQFGKPFAATIGEAEYTAADMRASRDNSPFMARQIYILVQKELAPAAERYGWPTAAGNCRQ